VRDLVGAVSDVLSDQKLFVQLLDLVVHLALGDALPLAVASMHARAIAPAARYAPASRHAYASDAPAAM